MFPFIYSWLEPCILRLVWHVHTPGNHDQTVTSRKLSKYTTRDDVDGHQETTLKKKEQQASSHVGCQYILHVGDIDEEACQNEKTTSKGLIVEKS